MAAVVLLGSALRFAALGSESIWRDEGTSIQLAHMETDDLLRDRAGFNHSPLYFVMLRGWVGLFGDSEISVRTPSALFGGVVVLMVFVVTLQLWRRRGTALIAALLASVSLFQIEYSQEARMYSLVALLALASMACFIRLLRRGDGASWGGFILANILLVYTHPSGWSLVLVQNLAWTARRLTSPKRNAPGAFAWIASQAILIALFMPWAWAMTAHDSGLPLRGNFSLSKLRNAFKGHAGGYLLLTPYLLLTGWGLVAHIRRRALLAANSGREWIALHGNELAALAWWLGPLVVMSAMSILSSTRIMNRYTMIASLAMFPLAAAGIAALPRRSLRFAAIGLILALSVRPLLDYYANPQKDGWRAAARFLDARAGKNEPVLFLMYRAPWYIKSCFDYYSDNPELDKQRFPVHVRPLEGRLKKGLPDRLLKHRQLWLVRLDARSWSKNEILLAEAGYRRTVAQRFSGLLVGLWEEGPRKPEPSP